MELVKVDSWVGPAWFIVLEAKVWTMSRSRIATKHHRFLYLILPVILHPMNILHRHQDQLRQDHNHLTIFEEKMEYLGIRGTAYSLIQSYLTERTAFSEVQGYTGKLWKCGPYSVVQSGKMSGQYFGIYTVEMTMISQIIKDNSLYQYITGELPSNDKTTNTSNTGYIDIWTIYVVIKIWRN